MSPLVKVEISGHVHRASLNRPGQGNSLSSDLVEALHETVDGATATGARVLILQGEGRNLCTGFDLSDLSTATDGDLLLRFVRIEELLARLWSAPYATIAVGRGRVFGAGADMFAACDCRIALDGATFSFPGAAFGLVLGVRRLGARVGAPSAQRLVTGGQVVEADAARQLELATHRASSSDIEAILLQEAALAMRLHTATLSAVRHALTGGPAAHDTDLAALVRSASRPMLGQRIAAYRARTLAAHRSAQDSGRIASQEQAGAPS